MRLTSEEPIKQLKYGGSHVPEKRLFSKNTTNIFQTINEPRHEKKQHFAYAQISFAVTAFVFATLINTDSSTVPVLSKSQISSL